MRLGVVTQAPIEALPGALRGVVAQHWRVGDALHLEQLTGAVAAMGERLGGIDRLFAAYEQLQVPMRFSTIRLAFDRATRPPSPHHEAAAAPRRD